MNRRFGQIPKPNPEAASRVADAARQVEGLLGIDPDDDANQNKDRFPRPGIDIPGPDDICEEVVEAIDPASLPGQEHGDETYDGSVGGAVENGVEYLAFYKSFRDVDMSPARGRWGVFFVKKRCLAVAADMSLDTGEPFSDCLDGLAAFLYAHELYHYRFDAHCLQMEATGGLSVYRPYRNVVAIQPIDEWHEESIANYYGLKALQPKREFFYPQPICDYLYDLVKYSPGAYAGGIARQQKARRDDMLKQATPITKPPFSPQQLDLIKSTIRLGMSLSRPNESTLSYFLRLDICPVYWIDWVSGGSSVLVPQAVPVREINGDFIKRYLNGVPDHHSDHSHYRIDNGERVKLPNPHRPDLTHGEFKNIIHKAGMTSPLFHSERVRTSHWRKHVPRKPPLASL